MRRAAPSGQSKFARKNLRQKVECPDSSGGSDVVTYAYDTSGAQMWRKDQAGTIVETSFDAAGRREHERVTTLASGFDDAVRRITTAYDSTGRAQTVSSYDDATVGSGSVVNQVKSEWDGWGGLVRFAVDPDSAVDATGSTAPTKNVTYEYAKATSGRNTIRRTSATLAGATVTYL